MGSLLYLRDEPEQALASLETAFRLSPNDHTIFYLYGEKGMAHLMLGQFADSVQCADRAIMLRQSYWYGHAIKINALNRAGATAAAERAQVDLRVSIPGFEAAFADWLPFIDPKWNLFLKDGLNL